VLSRMDLAVVARFLADPLAQATAPAGADQRPTETIIGFLERRGHLPAAVATTPIA
jgi:hypothetical protein